MQSNKNEGLHVLLINFLQLQFIDKVKMANGTERQMINSLICPITRQLFSVPVLADDDYRFEG